MIVSYTLVFRTSIYLVRIRYQRYATGYGGSVPTFYFLWGSSLEKLLFLLHLVALYLSPGKLAATPSELHSLCGAIAGKLLGTIDGVRYMLLCSA